MEYVRLGKTNALISRVAFGALRLENIKNEDDVAALVHSAYNAGINFFDTSRKNPASEKLLGDSLHELRHNVFLSTSTTAKTASEIERDLEESLTALHSDFVDLYQIETEKFLPKEGGADKIYDTLLKLKEEKKIRNIGIITTNYETAKKAIVSDLYDCLQFPFNVLNFENVSDVVSLCEKHDVGFVAMQPLCGGLVENIPLAFGFLHQYESVVPIWGIYSQEELNQILYFNDHLPVVDEKFHQDVEKLKNLFN